MIYLTYNERKNYKKQIRKIKKHELNLELIVECSNKEMVCLLCIKKLRFGEHNEYPAVHYREGRILDNDILIWVIFHFFPLVEYYYFSLFYRNFSFYFVRQ